MEALQYIYTSWKNGDSTEKGYMIYSRSEGITEAECGAIKDAMQYLAPKELNLTPTEQEIADVFPYAFSYFILPTGRGCVAQSTYLGKDYSGRFGNYIIYAMVFDINDLPCRPAEFFAEPYIKTAMTNDELNAPSPVPPLPPLRISQYASVINDDQLNEFLFDKEDEFAQVIAMVLAARDAGIPFYLNDTRENLVLWSAAIQRILPSRISKKFMFNTYIGDHETMRSPRIREEGLNFHLIGVRPDANYFNYSTECKSNRHMVMDFVGGHMTQGVEPTSFAQAMASSLAMDYEEVDSFGDFVDATSFNEISGRLQDAYLYYRLLRYDEFDFYEDNLKAALAFGTQYCSDADNSDIGSKLLVKFQENGWILTPDVMAEFWSFICKYSSFMIFTLFDLLQETLYQHSGEATEPCTALESLLQKIRTNTPQQYREYLEYLNSTNSVEQLLLYLVGHRNLYTNSFYANWLLQSYAFADGLNDRQPVSKLLSTLLNNITHIDGSEKSMVEILFTTETNHVLFENVLRIFMGAIQDTYRIEQLCTKYVEVADTLPDKQINRFEQLLLETPGAAPIATRLCARKIASAKKPEEEFWRFYQNQRSRISSSAGITIDPMVLACLNSIDGNTREDVAIDMMCDLDLTLLSDAETIKLLTNIINDCSIKSLVKMERTLLQRTCQLRAKVETSGLDKIKAVYIGELLEANNSQRKRPVSLSGELAQTGMSVASFNRADYEAYIKNYFSEFFALLQATEDVSALMQIFYHNRLFSDFTSDYISALKKLEKKEHCRWQRIVAWTCVYLITTSKSDQAAEELYKPMIRYLRSFDEEELMNVRQTVIQDVPGSRCDYLFDEVRRKEGLTEKLGGLFHRK